MNQGHKGPAFTLHHRLQELIHYLEERSKYNIGFPGSIDFNYSAIYPALDYLINNVGDPYQESSFALQTKDFEREVVTFFADIFRAPKDDRWGYVTSGGTEGNLYALFLSRELYPEGIVYFSKSTHYSVRKSLHLLRMPSITVKTQPNGEMDYDDLHELLRSKRDKPAIVLANIGTTMHEARDNVARIKSILVSLAILNCYIHSDAALSGVACALTKPHHPFDFEDGADSIAISGHKFIGSPIPCGVVVTRKRHHDRFGQLIPYIDSHDTTISGSRNGHTPLFLWYAIQRFGREGFRHRAEQAIHLADYTLECLRRIGWKAWRNPNTMTVLLEQPPADIIKKWQLATSDGWSHVICMPGVTRNDIDRFISDLEKSKEVIGESAYFSSGNGLV